MEWLGLMPEMMDAVAVVYVCMTFLFSSLFIISYLNVQHYRLHFKSSVCQLVGHTSLESHSVSHQEAMFFLFQIVLVDLSGVFFPHSIVQDPPFSLCMMCLKSGWTKLILD